MATESILTPERLRELLNYDPETGKFWWIRKPRRGGNEAGSVSGKYLRIGIDRKRYSASRLAWFYMTGNWPTPQIDHRDRNSLNNRWDNLREATHSQNGRNRGISKRNKSGVVGVHWSNQAKQWRVCIGREHLGYCKTLEEAKLLSQRRRMDC